VQRRDGEVRVVEQREQRARPPEPELGVAGGPREEEVERVLVRASAVAQEAA
jgi:hypothetical protein